jgi:hypothetical protein
MKNAETTPAVEAKAEGTNQVAVARRLGIALGLRKKFCGPRFGEGSLLRGLVREKCLRWSIRTHQVLSHLIRSHPNAVVYHINLHRHILSDRVDQSTCDDDAAT